MHQGFAPPSSLQLELEARRMHAGAAPAGLADVLPALALRDFPLAFDLGLGAAAAALVFPALLFPSLSPTAALSAGLALWSLAYLASPLGVALFGAVRRRHGAGVQFTAARFLLGASMAAVAFVPDFASAGWGAALFLAVCRIAYGLALGGATHEGVTRPTLALASPKRPWGALGPTLAVLLGLAAATALESAPWAALSHADFLSWGWRYPFILGVPANIVALFAQLRLFTTDIAERPGGSGWGRRPHVGGINPADRAR